jgi:uncharacterized protein CbrC (UPF0167 family)
MNHPAPGPAAPGLNDASGIGPPLHFRYHPDPVRSGSVVPSSNTCRLCDQARGWLYAGPVYAEEQGLEDAICPWCIADGSAHRAFDATFVDCEAFADELPAAVVDSITGRTPGYAAWQGEHWPVCCGDATAFIEPMGAREVSAAGAETLALVLEHVIDVLGLERGPAARTLQALSRDGSPTAYRFECLACGRKHFHIDGL